jgi:hydrogenase maturation protease
MKTLILALGNPILSDDGVAWEIADRIEASLPCGSAHILRESSATLDLLGKFAPYDRLFVLDAILTGSAPIGTVHRFSPADLQSTVRFSSAHDINFATAFEIGRQLGYRIPPDIRIFGIEVKELTRFAEGCTPEVRAVIPAAAEEICREIMDPPH